MTHIVRVISIATCWQTCCRLKMRPSSAENILEMETCNLSLCLFTPPHTCTYICWTYKKSLISDNTNITQSTRPNRPHLNLKWGFLTDITAIVVVLTFLRASKDVWDEGLQGSQMMQSKECIHDDNFTVMMKFTIYWKNKNVACSRFSMWPHDPKCCIKIIFKMV